MIYAHFSFVQKSRFFLTLDEIDISFLVCLNFCANKLIFEDRKWSSTVVIYKSIYTALLIAVQDACILLY